MENIPLGQFCKQGLIMKKQLSYALTKQKETAGKRLGDVMVELGYVTESDLLKGLRTASMFVHLPERRPYSAMPSRNCRRLRPKICDDPFPSKEESLP
jgi:hypothetical protein